ncbi:MAG: leucine-rich repeat domain-containing protein, partial [Bacteroidota bacterium]
MKQLLVFAFLCLSTTLLAQSTYQEAIDQGDAALKRGAYKVALNKYFAADAFAEVLPDKTLKKAAVKKKINRVFDRIEGLKDQAEKTALELQLTKDSMQVALNQAQKLIDAFYFYEDKYALAFGQQDSLSLPGFYFIDEKGNRQYQLGTWLKADLFNEHGYATVMDFIPEKYWLDTVGNIYRLAEGLNEVDSLTMAADFYSQQLESIPDSIWDFHHLRMLDLSWNPIQAISPKISQLHKLQWLNLSHVHCFTLPEELGQLKNLQYLNLNGSFIAVLPSSLENLRSLQVLDLR